MSDSLITSTLAALLALASYFLIKKFKHPGGAKTGATPFLNLYTTDFTALAAQGRIDPVIGRDDEVRKLIQVLARRTKNNAILVGHAGVGKTAIVEGFAVRVAKGEVPGTLGSKRVLALDIAGLMGGTKYRGEFENRAKKIVAEITASGRSIILFIDEIHSLVQSQGSEGALNLSDILKPALSRGDLQMIGATTFEEYEKYFKTDLSLERRFQPIEVAEPSPEETLLMLQGIKDKYREYHKVEFTDAALETAVNLSDHLTQNRKLPDKAIDALDEAAAMIKIGHLHPSVAAVLYQAAVAQYPEVAELWSAIQALDNKIVHAAPTETGKLKMEREKLEQTLADKGVVTVDSSDVEKIITEWI